MATRKRKPGGGIGKTADLLKYFDTKIDRTRWTNGPDGPLVKLAHFVKDGLKVHEKAVETIGLAVKYIKNSSQRIEKFKTSIKNTCDSNRFLIAECPTRWNSTYDMLKSAIELQEAFYNYSMKNASFSRDLEAIPRRSLMKMVVYMRRNEYEENTPFDGKWLTDNEKEDKVKQLVYEVETNMGVLFALYNEKNALSPQIVEALLCTQSWVRTSQKNIYMDDLEDLMKDEEVVKEMKEAEEGVVMRIGHKEEMWLVLWPRNGLEMLVSCLHIE
ncbi:zinc finger BED domain-containing protein RICESLEEPER 2 [Tanacetum coccineum]